MKCILVTVIGIIFLLNVFSCSTKEETLDDFGRAFFNAAKNNDREEAKKLFLTQDDFKQFPSSKDIDELKNDSTKYDRFLNNQLGDIDNANKKISALSKETDCGIWEYSKIEAKGEKTFGATTSYDHVNIYIKCGNIEKEFGDPDWVTKINGKWKMLEWD